MWNRFCASVITGVSLKWNKTNILNIRFLCRIHQRLDFHVLLCNAWRQLHCVTLIQHTHSNFSRKHSAKRRFWSSVRIAIRVPFFSIFRNVFMDKLNPHLKTMNLIKHVIIFLFLRLPFLFGFSFILKI